jgi:hypothetical protein
MTKPRRIATSGWSGLGTGWVRAGSDPERRAKQWTTRQIRFSRVVIVLSLHVAYLVFRRPLLDVPGARFAVVLWILALACLVGSAVGRLQAQRLGRVPFQRGL